MNKKDYIVPEVKIEDLRIDSAFASGCGSKIPFDTVGCLASGTTNSGTTYGDYQAFIKLGFGDDVPLDDPAITSMTYSRGCFLRCYQAPYGNYYNS